METTEEAFGAAVDYGQAVKFYEADPIGLGRYSPSYVVRQKKAPITGRPDEARISTSLVERQNLTHEDEHSSLHKADKCFSKKVENHRAALLRRML